MMVKSGVLFEERDDKRKEVSKYLAKHNIHAIFEKLCASLIYHKPANPNSFLIRELQKVCTRETASRTTLCRLTQYTSLLDSPFPLCPPLCLPASASCRLAARVAGHGCFAFVSVALHRRGRGRLLQHDGPHQQGNQKLLCECERECECNENVEARALACCVRAACIVRPEPA